MILPHTDSRLYPIDEFNFGLKSKLGTEARAYWGTRARWNGRDLDWDILHTEIGRRAKSQDAYSELSRKLHAEGALPSAHRAFRDFVKKGLLTGSSAREVCLWNRDGVRIFGSSSGSCVYFHLIAILD